MRVLKFDISGQKISQDPKCDFSGIVAGTSNYLQAEFSFSDEWKDCILVASFWRGKEEHAMPIKDGKCFIPKEALTRASFSVSVTGKNKDYIITTNKIYIRQEVVR